MKGARTRATITMHLDTDIFMTLALDVGYTVETQSEKGDRVVGSNPARGWPPPRPVGL